MIRSNFFLTLICTITFLLARIACNNTKNQNSAEPAFFLKDADTILFNSFVDCNMAEAWIGDTFRIFPGKYGEDTVWGPSKELMFANARNAPEAFATKAGNFKRPMLPPVAPIGQAGFHGAMWFESVYQSEDDVSKKPCMQFITMRIIRRIFPTTVALARVILIICGQKDCVDGHRPRRFAG